MKASAGGSAFSAYEQVLKALLGDAAPAKLSPADRLASLGWDSSVALVQLVAQLEEALDIVMPPETLLFENFETVDSLWLVLRAILDIDAESHQ